MSGYSGVRVLVTGASGFLGSHTAERLVSQGARVHVFVRPSSSLDRLENLSSDITTHVGNILDYPSVLGCLRIAQPEIVFHLAGDTTGRRSSGGWEAIERSIDVNLRGTMNVVRGAAESGAPVRTVLRVGGLEEYGTCAIPFVESDREQPVSAYSASQVATAHFCQMLQRSLEFQIVTIRPALVYGPGQARHFFIPELIESCLRGDDFDMTGGTQSRDFIYVDDVAEGILMSAMKPNIPGAVINLASGKEHSLSEVADEIVQLTGASIRVRKGARPTDRSDLQHLVGSTAHAEQTLGWKSRTGLSDGLAKTVEWHRLRR